MAHPSQLSEKDCSSPLAEIYYTSTDQLAQLRGLNERLTQLLDHLGSSSPSEGETSCKSVAYGRLAEISDTQHLIQRQITEAEVSINTLFSLLK